MSQEETQDVFEFAEEHDVLRVESELSGDDVECLATLEYQCVGDGGSLEIPLYPRKEIRIGRDRKCNYTISDNRISKHHFRIYSIIYETTSSYDTETPKIPPLVYCEDLESSNGTYINGDLIGILSHERVGHLLCDGDVVEIRPHWKFRFHQPNHQKIYRQKAQSMDLDRFKDRYTVSDRILGAGRYGNVYLATELATMKQVACKVVDLNSAMQSLSDSQVTSPAADGIWKSGFGARMEEKKVLREIRILSKLSHPNIISLKKAFCSNNALYIITDLAPAGDLFSYMQSQGGYLDDYNSRVVTRQLVLALDYIHSKGITHRDIKPENVLVMNTDFGGRIILTDFGFATYANFRTGRMLSKLGTPGFVAPEVESVEKTSGYTTAADMWSLGVMAACLFTGDTMIPRVEMSQLSQIELAERILAVKDSHLRHQWTHMPPRALDFIRKLLIANPEERMTAARALDHSWYSKPAREAEALAEGLNRINRFWKPREPLGDKVLEDLPGTLLTATTVVDTPTTKLQGKIPDASLSPYFGLDRHLNRKVPSARKRILADLNETGTHFITYQAPQQRSPIANIGLLKDRCGNRVIFVEGRDLFGMSPGTTSAPEPLSDLDKFSVIPTAPVPQTTKQFGFDSRPVANASNPAMETQSTDITNGPGPSKSKRARKGAGANNETIHSNSRKDLPQRISTRALRNSVSKMEGMDENFRRDFISIM